MTGGVDATKGTTPTRAPQEVGPIPGPPAFDAHHPPRLDLVSDCVHCGFCLPTCPTYVLWGEEMDSPRGRIHLMAQGLAGEPLSDSMVEHFDRCLGCMACVTACPSGVRYDRLIEDTRQQVERRHPRSVRDRALRAAIFALFPYPRRLRLMRGPLRATWLRRFGGRIAPAMLARAPVPAPELRRDDPASAPRAAAFAAKVRDLSELLVELGPVAPRHPLPVSIAYHDACHLAHAQGVRVQPRALLRGIPELTVCEIADPEICCGSAGVWNILNPEPAQELGERKARAGLATRARPLVTPNPGCPMQVAAAGRSL